MAFDITSPATAHNALSDIPIILSNTLALRENEKSNEASTPSNPTPGQWWFTGDTEKIYLRTNAGTWLYLWRVSDPPAKSSDLTAHTGLNITQSVTVHGIRQGSGNGLDADKVDGYEASAFLQTSHGTASSGTHGVGAGSIVGTTLTQTLTNKTLTSPVVTSPSVTGGTFGGSPAITTPVIDTPVISNLSSSQHGHSGASSGGLLGNGVVTGAMMYNHVPGTTLYHSNDAEKTTTSTPYVQAKAIVISRGGTYRINFDLQGNAGGNVYGRIRRNGVDVGTEQVVTWQSPAYATKSQDISGWSVGDSLELHFHSTNGGTAAIKNFRLYVSQPETPWNSLE